MRPRTAAADESDIVARCLAASRSATIFIGLLGERYGWVPGAVSPELLDAYPELKQCDGYSAMELEVRVGALSGARAPGTAFFYFRSPEFLAEVPPMHRGTYACESEWARARLAELKADLLQSGFHVTDGYSCWWDRTSGSLGGLSDFCADLRCRLRTVVRRLVDVEMATRRQEGSP